VKNILPYITNLSERHSWGQEDLDKRREADFAF
jgi:hypothetical protein